MRKIYCIRIETKKKERKIKGWEDEDRKEGREGRKGEKKSNRR